MLGIPLVQCFAFGVLKSIDDFCLGQLKCVRMATSVKLLFDPITITEVNPTPTAMYAFLHTSCFTSCMKGQLWIPALRIMFTALLVF